MVTTTTYMISKGKEAEVRRMVGWLDEPQIQACKALQRIGLRQSYILVNMFAASCESNLSQHRARETRRRSILASTTRNSKQPGMFRLVGCNRFAGNEG